VIRRQDTAFASLAGGFLAYLPVFHAPYLALSRRSHGHCQTEALTHAVHDCLGHVGRHDAPIGVPQDRP
jgi:hypothetical protein